MNSCVALWFKSASWKGPLIISLAYKLAGNKAHIIYLIITKNVSQAEIEVMFVEM